MTEPAHPPLPRALAAVHAFDRRLQTAEVAVCMVALGLMVVLAFLQVVLRQLQGATFQPVGWFDRVSMLMVIWVAMLGASVATAEGRHISIEALPKLLGPTGKRRLALFVNLVAAVVTGVMLALSLVYMQLSQLPDTNHLFVIKALELEVYRWPFLLVVPWGLGVMTLRFVLRAVESVVLDDEAFAALQPDEVSELDAEPEDIEAEADSEVGDLLEQAQAAVAESDVGASDEAPPRARQTGEPPRLVGTTTQELDVYQDLSDQGDVNEPELRRGGPVRADLTESGDILASHHDTEDDDPLGEADTQRLEGAEDAVERVAETQRLADASDERPEAADDDPPSGGAA